MDVLYGNVKWKDREKTIQVDIQGSKRKNPFNLS